ncbi:MAG: cache domain-containing protein, partial [Deltaproteobacteria bacterium]|nr:cache domain-containing protein [Deltaproteobacteria bacterium]
LLIVIPLSLMAVLIANGIFKLGDTARERAVTVLDQKSQEEIKIRAENIAEDVADFLREREKDILVTTILPPTENAFKEFISKNKKALWVKRDGNIFQIMEPLYTELAMINSAGNEVIKISGGQVVPQGNLINISNPANTTYKSEDYFAQAKKLNKGEVYIGPVTGWYISKPDFDSGKRFTGIMRLATPIFDKQGFAGIICLSLDVRHLAKFTDSIIPTQSGYVVESDASTGNYAYIINNRGFVISHPSDYHIAGLRQDGTPVPPLTDQTMEAMTKRGEEVLNLNLLGFMDAGLPEVTKDAASGKAGMKTYKFAGRTKFVAYAPIKFYSQDYPKPGGFGWVGMGVDVGIFSEIAASAGKKIQQEAESWITTITVIIIISVVLLFLIVAILARGVTRSVIADVPEDAKAAGEYYDDDDDDKDD